MTEYEGRLITHWSQARTEEEEAKWWDKNGERLSRKAWRDRKSTGVRLGWWSRPVSQSPLEKARIRALQLGVRLRKRTTK